MYFIFQHILGNKNFIQFIHLSEFANRSGKVETWIIVEDRLNSKLSVLSQLRH